MYIYESHLGGLYVSDDWLDNDFTYCEECGDSDWLVGTAETREEAWDLLKEQTDIDGSGGYNYEYVQGFINGNWEDEGDENG